MRWKLKGAACLVMAAFGMSVAQAAETAAPKSIWDQDRTALTGDWGGARTKLKDDTGIEVTLKYINEVLDVASGGINRRASYEGRLEFSLDQDLERWLPGAKTHVTIYQIHGSANNAAANVGSIADPSNIDAFRTTRLFTAYFQYGDPDKPKDAKKKADFFSLRIGQLAADDEFIV